MSLVGLELDNGGVAVKFLQTAFETKAAIHKQEGRSPPRSPLPPYHRPPKQDERFKVLEGALKFHVDGVDRIVKAGEEIDITKGSYRWVNNPHDEPAIVIWETRPALRTAEFFHAMSRASGGRPRPGLADAAAILREYGDVFELAKPPVFLQRIVFGCLAPFGKVPPPKLYY